MKAEPVRIEVGGWIDAAAARGLCARIRAALSNHPPVIELCFAEDTRIASAHWLAYLRAVSGHARTYEWSFRLRGGGPALAPLLRIVGLDEIHEPLERA